MTAGADEAAEVASRAVTWKREAAPDAARERLLDAAGRVFAERGVLTVTVADVAAAAGCSRGTVHRYFGDRESLRRAFVDREAARVWRRVGRQLDPTAPPAERVVDGVLTAVAEVRADPVLAAWFTGEAALASGRLSLQAGAVRRLTGRWVRSLLAEAAEAGIARRDLDPAVATDAVVRVILSLLTVPVGGRSAGAAAAAERALVEALLVPALFTS